MELNHYAWKEEHPKTDDSVYFRSIYFPRDPSWEDFSFRKYCFEVERYDPFKGSKLSPKKTPPFKKKSKAYDEFKSLVYSKGWISPYSVPKFKATDHDEDLKEFLEKYGVKRSQVRTKFNELMKLTDVTSRRMPSVKGHLW